mmetsp:Transcript_22493/g.31372  ORF Transcript_22493/g.31372 Transcript_22493/m.31372 type:complete len:179 (-) Transcript_22493:207-743(-)
MRFAFTANKKQEEQQAQPCIRGPDYGRSSLIRRTSERVMISARRLAELEKEHEEKKRKENKVGVFDSIVSVTTNINHGIQDALLNASDHMRRRNSSEDYSISSYSHNASDHVRRRNSNEDHSISSYGGESFAGDHDCGALNNSHHERRERASQKYENDDDDVSEEELQARRGSIMVSW